MLRVCGSISAETAFLSDTVRIVLVTRMALALYAPSSSASGLESCFPQRFAAFLFEQELHKLLRGPV